MYDVIIYIKAYIYKFTLLGIIDTFVRKKNRDNKKKYE